MNKEKIIKRCIYTSAIVLVVVLFIFLRKNINFLEIILIFVCFEFILLIILELYLRIQHNVDKTKENIGKTKENIGKIKENIGKIKASIDKINTSIDKTNTNISMGEKRSDILNLFLLQEKLIELLELKREDEGKHKKIN